MRDNTGLFVQPMYKNDFAPAAIQLHLNREQHVNTTKHLKMAALLDTVKHPDHIDNIVRRLSERE